MRGRLLLVVVGLALVVTPAFVYPQGGLAVYEYDATTDPPYYITEYASEREFVDCRLNEQADCVLARYARDEGGIVVDESHAHLTRAVALVDDSQIRYYWVNTSETANGTAIAVSRVDTLESLYELVATPKRALPKPARAAVRGQSQTVATSHTHEYDPAYLVRHNGEWRSVERQKVRSSGLPLWVELLRVIGPPVGAALLVLASTRQREYVSQTHRDGP